MTSLPPGEPPAGHPEVERFDPGLARERTELAWTRSALSLAASGALIARACLAAHLDVLGTLIAIVTAALVLIVWHHGEAAQAGPGTPDVVRHRDVRALAGLTIATLITALLAIIVTVAV